ncbi:uncharacterized protein P884DRAFT_273356 [Thermothelomyces heterothallicus CBS 202.75]|uniref:uncharacterized protein n=1 Tax=Thermothelomyces heterothallicus CBS 202.75 TaxID=1149848 RepID=UPI0037439FBF
MLGFPQPAEVEAAEIGLRIPANSAAKSYQIINGSQAMKLKTRTMDLGAKKAAIPGSVVREQAMAIFHPRALPPLAVYYLPNLGSNGVLMKGIDSSHLQARRDHHALFQSFKGPRTSLRGSRTQLAQFSLRFSEKREEKPMQILERRPGH